MLYKNSLCTVLISVKPKPSSSSRTMWLIGYLNMSYHIIVKYLLMLYCALSGSGGPIRSMVPNSNSRITNHIKQSQCNSHFQERMAQFLGNSEVFLVPALDVDILNIRRQNVELTQILLVTSWALAICILHGSIKGQFNVKKKACILCQKSNS